MVKVYIIRWFDGEPYSDWQGVHKVFATRDGAEKYLADKGIGPHDLDTDDYEYGYYLSKTIEEHEVSA